MKTFCEFIPLFLAIFFYAVQCDDKKCAKEGSSRSPSLKVKNKIFCNYDKEYRPIKDQNKALNISLRLVPKYLDSYGDELTMDVQNWIGVVWKDDFLTWNPSDYDSLKSIHVTSDEIWTPDLQLYKDLRTKESLFDSDASCTVSKDGYVNCVIENDHEAQCTSDVHEWPYDTRNCELTYTTGIYNTSEIIITKNSIFPSTLQPNPVWELLSFTHEETEQERVDQKYNMIIYRFQVKRHSARTINIILIPGISLMTMTLVPLWMHPTNTERFCLIAANILSHLLFIQHLNWIAPSHENRLPPAVTFFRDSMGLAIAVLIELTLVKSLLGEKTACPVWLTRPCRFLAGGVMRKMLIAENVQEIKDEESMAQIDEKDAKSKQIQEERCLIVTVLDRLLFFALSVAYFVLVILLIPFK